VSLSFLFITVGKTTTVVEVVYQLVARNQKKVLLLAPSNDAADLLVERLQPFFPPSELCRSLAFTRSIEAMTSSIRPYGLAGTHEDQKPKLLSSRIVVSTVNNAAKFCYYGIPRGHFDVLVVDEAGHATEPEVISVAGAIMDFELEQNPGQIVLAGDPMQLWPVVSSEVCRDFGLPVSYMERLMGRDTYSRHDGKYPSDLLTKLVRNYRSHPNLIKIPNEKFYDNELECCGEQMTTHNLCKWEHLPEKGFPILFHSMTGENLREANSPSWFNPLEAQQVLVYVKLLLKETRPPLRPDEIGIITPYARQAQKIRAALVHEGVVGIKVGSVEVFQGQEYRCIIISTVRSEKDKVSTDLRHNLGFVSNPKRFNVAMTRAQALLIVVGCPAILAVRFASNELNIAMSSKQHFTHSSFFAPFHTMFRWIPKIGNPF
jgi:superfamily I DNA and/or RNA helicase